MEMQTNSEHRESRGNIQPRLIVSCVVFVVLLVFSLVSLIPANANNKNEGCFDNRRFCFELTPLSHDKNRYQVTVKRYVSLPVALTLYSDALYSHKERHGVSEASTRKPIAHANAFLDSDDPIVLGEVASTRQFWRTMRVKWTVGDINATHDGNIKYLPPLQPAKQYRIVQGFNGNFSHTGSSRYALDFAAPVGTPILAARSGVVIDTKDDGKKGGASSRFAKHANYVVILHSDGTTGEYYHLKYKGVAVKQGQEVQQGQLIGYTGNTGFSSLPHLHFGIYVAKFHGGYQSVPFELSSQ